MNRQGLGIVVHSFWNRWQAHHAGVYPPPMAVAEVAAEMGFSGVQTLVAGWGEGEAEEVRAFLDEREMRLEGSIEVPQGAEDVERFRADLQRGVTAGAGLFRCYLGWRRYEEHSSPQEVAAYLARVEAALGLAVPELERVGARLAVENHKDLRAAELRQLLDGFSSEAVGCCLDLANNLALLEPIEETLTLLGPHVMAVHLKDVAVAPRGGGFAMAEVPLGRGVLDLPTVVGQCRAVAPDAVFSLEMITRAPLVVPCSTERYCATLGVDEFDARLGAMLKWVTEHEVVLPSIEGFSPEELVNLERDQIAACLCYARAELGF